MSEYDMNSFISDFAKRTKENLKMINILAEKEKQYYLEMINLEEKNHYKVLGKTDPYKETRIFEVTQLINSFLGLIILPNEKFKNSKKKDIKELRENNKKIDAKMNDVENGVMDLLNKCKGGYVNSYNDFQKDDVVFNLCRHLRNAVAHRGVYFDPLVEGDAIDGIIFYESNYGCHKLNEDTENEIKDKIIKKIKKMNIMGEDDLEKIKKEIGEMIKKSHSNAKEFCLQLDKDEVTVLAGLIADFYSCLERLEGQNLEYTKWITKLKKLLKKEKQLKKAKTSEEDKTSEKDNTSKKNKRKKTVAEQMATLKKKKDNG